MYLYKKENGKKFDLKIARYRGLPDSGWTYQSETTLLSCLNSLLRISIRPLPYDLRERKHELVVRMVGAEKFHNL